MLVSSSSKESNKNAIVKEPELYLEGTKDILNEFNANDKRMILEYASTVEINALKEVSKWGIQKYALKIRNGYKFEYPYNIIVKGVNEALKFYFSNLPKGFTRLKDHYEMANRDGVILRFNRRKAKAQANKDGYLNTTINLLLNPNNEKPKTTLAHRIIAAIYIPNPDKKPEVNHKDGNKQNNAVSNLEWVTPKENSQHAHATGLISLETMTVSQTGKLTYDEKDVLYMRLHIRKMQRDSKMFLAKALGLTDNEINDIIDNSIAIPLNSDKYIKLIKGLGPNNLNKHTIHHTTGDFKCNKVRSIYFNSYAGELRSLATKYNVTYDTIMNIISYRRFRYKSIREKEKELLKKEGIYI